VPIVFRKWTTWIFVLLVGCAATRATAQIEPLKIKDLAALSYTPTRWSQPEILPEVSLVPGDDNTPAADSSNSTAPSDSNALAADSSNLSAGKNGAAVELPAPKKRFQWKPALLQTAFSVTVYNGWRFAHESGTRDALTGPWLKHWIDSIGETRGWDDSDGWHASYVSHPFEGAIFGYIEQQNDPLYRQVTDAFTG
jgi:hypothetical protein